MTKKRNHIPFEDYLTDKLKDPELALAYLNEALKDKDDAVALLALKDVVAAHGVDMSELAKEAALSRQNLYRMLSTKGNPRFNNLRSLADALGYDIQFHPKNK